MIFRFVLFKHVCLGKSVWRIYHQYLLLPLVRVVSATTLTGDAQVKRNIIMTIDCNGKYINASWVDTGFQPTL